MIELTLLGRPGIKMNGQKAELPFKQAEAIVYYLAAQGEVSRLSLADIVWGDKCDGEKMKANMRNAAYVLRKTFGNDFLDKTPRDRISINPARSVRTDLDLFLKTPKHPPQLYTGDFLEDFYLKDNELYNEWAENIRQKYRGVYVESLKRHIGAAFAANNVQRCLQMCHQLIACNEFDEFGYKYMIEIYKGRKDYANAIAVYNRLERLLSEELFEPPGRELVTLAQEVKNARTRELAGIVITKSSVKGALDVQSSFYGREREIALISDSLTRFAAAGRGRSVAILGEAGIGKSRLAEVALSEPAFSGLLILKTRCYRAEENYILKPWQAIFEQLIDSMVSLSDSRRKTDFLSFAYAYFPYLRRKEASSIDLDEISPFRDSSAETVVTSALIMLSKQKRMVLYFDDLQWADEVSVSLIRNIITIDQNRNITFILACREELSGYCERLIEDAALSGLLRKIGLGCFTRRETLDFARLLLPDFHLDEALCRQLYHETEGNPFFVVETLNNFKYNGSLTGVTPNIRDVIKNRIACLTPESRRLLELMAIFFDGVPLDMLLELFGKDQYELVEILEYLIGNKIIREESYLNSVLLHFTHQKILEYVYGEMSAAKKMMLHNKVGLCYERQLENKPSDLPIYSKLIHHFEHGKTQGKYLKYILKYVYGYLNTAHEYYPVLENKGIDKDNPVGLLTDMGGVDSTLNNISRMITQAIGSRTDSESLEMLSDYYHMMGRYYIRKVEYGEGLRYIGMLKGLIHDYGDLAQCRNLIKANRQLMCVYINRCELQKMRETIEESFSILSPIIAAEETAIWERLAGLCDIMSGRVDSGIQRLSRAVDIFEASKDKEIYLFNLAASYAWLGEAQRHQKNYREALGYYDRAINICTGNYLIGGVCTFYTYAGLAAYDSGDIPLAETYLKDAIRSYEHVDLMWGRGMAHSYHALVLLSRGAYGEARDLLERAAAYADRLDSPYEKGVLSRIYAQLKDKMPRDPALRAAFGDALTETGQSYAQRARGLLQSVYSPIDIEYLDALSSVAGRSSAPAAESPGFSPS